MDYSQNTPISGTTTPGPRSGTLSPVTAVPSTAGAASQHSTLELAGIEPGDKVVVPANQDQDKIVVEPAPASTPYFTKDTNQQQVLRHGV
ncbi:hypothetical protein VTJ04DRAFT_8308 [Mycothermus thermophilus]|uniref:uncharacterized protein n=1 Tax=Humicola insolens TaxID=85995 RepID=UPI003743E89C